MKQEGNTLKNKLEAQSNEPETTKEDTNRQNSTSEALEKGIADLAQVLNFNSKMLLPADNSKSALIE